MIRASATFKPRSDIGRFVEAKVSPAVFACVETAGAYIRDLAKGYAPVRTGKLRDSITSEVVQLDKTIRAVVAPHVDYAEYVEFGTGRAGAASAGAGEGPYSPSWPGMPAQPFMRPAIDEGRGAVLEIFRNQLQVAFNA